MKPYPGMWWDEYISLKHIPSIDNTRVEIDVLIYKLGARRDSYSSHMDVRTTL